MNGAVVASCSTVHADESMVQRQDLRSWYRLMWVFVLVAAVGSAAALPQAAIYRGDERFYTDAAIQMRHSGDWWIPKDSDGRPRYVKPLLFYWAVAVSQSVFGASLWASRLPSWLAAMALLGVTWRLANTCCRDPRGAAWAVVLLATNPEFHHLATRSTPDMMLTLWLTLAVWGFVRLALREERTRGAAMAAWGSSALAMATKGLWGFAPVLHALAWSRFGTRRVSWHRWWSWRWALAALVVGASGYWIMVVFDGIMVASSAWHDQVALRWQAPESEGPTGWIRPVVYVGTLLRDFLPWSVLTGIALGLRGRGSSAAPREQPEAHWLLSWTLGVVTVLCMSNFVRLRYVFPVYPGFAVWLGNRLTRLSDEVPGLWERWDRWSRALAFTAATALVGVAGVASRLEVPIVCSTLGMACGLAVLGARCASWRLPLAVARFSAMPMLWSVWLSLVWVPVQSPSPAPAIAQVLKQQCGNLRDVVLVGHAARLAGQLRLLLDGQPWIRERPPETLPGQLAAESAVLVIGDSIEVWKQAGRRVRRVGTLPPRSFGQWWRATLRTRNHVQALERAGQTVWLAWCTEPPHKSPGRSE